MKRILLAIFFLFILPLAEAKDWRGITPLHSTKADVEKILGRTSDGRNTKYYLKDVNVFIDYSEGGCIDGKSGGWNIPPDTVIRFTVVTKYLPKFSTLEIDRAKFKEKKDEEVEGHLYYTNEEEGSIIHVSAYTGEVLGFYYGPSQKEASLRCPK